MVEALVLASVCVRAGGKGERKGFLCVCVSTGVYMYEFV